MTARWDVRTSGGVLVRDLTTLATVLRTSRADAAKALLSGPASAVAPPLLRRQALAEASRKDRTPPPIAAGSFVQVGRTRGRVDQVVTDGKVPGVDGDVTGTADSPAVRIVVWEPAGDNGYRPTRRRIAASTARARRIPPLHQAKAAPPPLPEAVERVVYERGMAAWPGYERTVLSRRGWAKARVAALAAATAGDSEAKAHPEDVALASSHRQPPVVVRAEDVARVLAMFEDV